MIVLGIETSNTYGSVALLIDNKIDEIKFQKGMIHARELGAAIQDLCKRNSIKPADINLVGCDIGPGSYTGIRVGLAHAKGLCYALKKEIMGICSLDALAIAVRDFLPDGCTITPLIDAKWGQLYFANYKLNNGIQKINGPFAESPEETVKSIPAGSYLIGDGVKFLTDINSGVCLVLNESYWYPKASVITTQAALEFSGGKRDNLYKLEPLYLRKTEAEENFRERGGAGISNLG